MREREREREERGRERERGREGKSEERERYLVGRRGPSRSSFLHEPETGQQRVLCLVVRLPTHALAHVTHDPSDPISEHTERDNVPH